MSKRKYDKEQLIELVPRCFNMCDLLTRLDLNLCSTNYYRMKRFLLDFQIDTSHFSRSRPKSPDYLSINRPRRKLEDYLALEGPEINSTSLKQKLYKTGILKPICSECRLTDIWNGKKLSLQLDHINGNHGDNRLENLRILCPNCHTQTETYSCKRFTKEPNKCLDCNKNIGRKSRRCYTCSNSSKNFEERIANYPRFKKIEWPKIDVLKEKLKTTSWVALAKELGVSDNAVRKHIWAIDPDYKKG